MAPDADSVKGIEALYNLTKSAYDAEISRYDATEAKAGRYLTVLGLMIGAFVVKFDDLLIGLADFRPRTAAVPVETGGGRNVPNGVQGRRRMAGRPDSRDVADHAPTAG